MQVFYSFAVRGKPVVKNLPELLDHFCATRQPESVCLHPSCIWTADLQNASSVGAEVNVAWRDTVKNTWKKYSLVVANQINHIRFGQSLKQKIAGGGERAQGKFRILALHLLSLDSCFRPLVCVLVGLFACPEQSTNVVPSCHKWRCGVPSSWLNCRGWHRESARL